MAIPIICVNCGNTGEVLRVTANLRCDSCHSTDLDLYDGPQSKTAGSDFDNRDDFDDGQSGSEDPKLEDLAQKAHETGFQHALYGWQPKDSHLNPQWNHEVEVNAYKAGHAKGLEYVQQKRGGKFATYKQAASPGTGWNKTLPDADANWSDYVGPPVGPNPLAGQNLDRDFNGVCPACNGSGKDDRASGGGYDEQICRNCHGTGKVQPTTGQPVTQSNDAHMPGPVPNGAGWQGGRQATLTLPGGQTQIVELVPVVVSPLQRMASAIKKANSGISEDEAFALAKRTVERYPEGVK